MRITSLWAGRAAILGLALVGLPAGAATATQQTLPWSVLPLVPARAESKAIGPDMVAAAPDGALAIWDPVDRAIRVLRSGAAPASIPTDHVDDLAWTAAGILLLDDTTRRLLLLSADGQRLATLPLPGLAPVGLSLAVDGDEIDGADVFGNRHPLARLAGSALVATDGHGLRPPAMAVRWDSANNEMWAGDRAFPVPGAIKASGRVLGGWLVVDAVTGDGPIQVRRTAIPLGGGDPVTLPVSTRLYAPTRDLAVNAAGHLFVLVPETAGLSIWEVTP